MFFALKGLTCLLQCDNIYTTKGKEKTKMIILTAMVGFTAWAILEVGERLFGDK